MAPTEPAEVLESVEAFSFNPKHAVSWLEQQTDNEQTLRVQELFQALLLSASKPKQSSGNACVKLCGLVELSAKSSSPQLREFAFGEATAVTLFNFFIEWNEQDAHRSMRLVLDFLVHSAMQNPSLQVSQSIKSMILDESTSIITEKSSRPSIKSALTALDHMLQKKLIFLNDVLATYQRIHKSRPSQETTWQSFIAQIFDWMILHYACPAAGKLIVTILTTRLSQDGDKRHPPSTWHDFIYPPLKANAELLEAVRLYILIPLFKTDRVGALEYLQKLTSLQGLTGERGDGWDLNAMLWLSMLESGKKAGVVDEPGQGLKQKPGAVTQLDGHVLEQVLCHESHDARSSAVAILIASPSTTRPYTPDVLDLLRKHLPSFHSDANSKFRYEVLGHSRNMIKRIHGALESLRREYEKAIRKTQGAPAQKDPAFRHIETTLRQHRDFVSWYFDFLKNEMSPTASYQRHITSMKAINYVLNSPLIQESDHAMFSEARSPFIDSVWLRCVLDLVMDPFDDVRDAAAALVMHLASSAMNLPSKPLTDTDGVDAEAEIATFCKRAALMASRTARADHSDGAARSYHLLHKWKSQSGEPLTVPRMILEDLETKIASAERDLASAVLETPVHGDFATLCYLWGSLGTSSVTAEDRQTLREIQERAIQCCQKVWSVVQHILCDDSPEGHLPEELEEVDGLDTKDLLSYSFRAIHESSNLLRVIASRIAADFKIQPTSEARSSFEAIGRLTFRELSTLRHRGAFTTVSQTFATCCQLVHHFSSVRDGVDLLNEWYQGALHCIYTQASTTRRSAGIPALVVGVLSANAEDPSFQDVIRELQRISRRPARIAETDGSNLSQVHALNCLKDIFKSSQLSKRAEPYLTECLELAAECLKSEVWAIRNCGLLMLRSLIDCLLGTNESKASIEAGWDGKTVRIPYHKFANLPAVLLNLLEMGKQADGVLIGSQSAESVFPALDIIRRAGPPEASRDELYHSISWYLGSRIWHVREIAARTLCSFLLRPGWNEDITQLISDSTSSMNKLHGALMTLKFLLRRLGEVMPEKISVTSMNSLIALLSTIQASVSKAHACTEVQAEYIDVINTLNWLTVEILPREELSLVTVPQAVSIQSFNDRTSALLHLRLGEAQTQSSTRAGQGISNGGDLKANLKTALDADVNVCCAMLETLSVLCMNADQATSPTLIEANMSVCLETQVPEPMSLALENISTLLSQALATKPLELSTVPATEELVKLWEKVASLPITPGLSEAVLQIGGCILSVVIARREQTHVERLPTWLRNWGAMLHNAGSADQTFDTRIAAASAMIFMSMVSFPPGDGAGSSASAEQAHLPWILALYNSLNDDDDEVRAVAATAAGNVLGGQSLSSIEASTQLLEWLCKKFGNTDEFRTHVACRMVGHTSDSHPAGALPVSVSASWTPAAEQLSLAMRFDDALFVVEEQNLYIDEVRESERWKGAFATCFPPSPAADESILEPLSAWTLAALQALNQIATKPDQSLSQGSDEDPDCNRDGPLGWTAKPAVFAICHRILICAVCLAGTGSGDGVTGDDKCVGESVRIRDRAAICQELVRFAETGKKNDVHGLLLSVL